MRGLQLLGNPGGAVQSLFGLCYISWQIMIMRLVKNAPDNEPSQIWKRERMLVSAEEI